jgi:hypothetical protein
MANGKEKSIGLDNNYSITTGLANGYAWVYQKSYADDLGFYSN